MLYNPPAADKESKRLGCKVTHGSPLPFINWEQEVTTCKNKISCETEWVSLSSSNVKVSHIFIYSNIAVNALEV